MKHKILLYTLLLFLLSSRFCFADSAKIVFPNNVKIEMVGEKKDESVMVWLAPLLAAIVSITAMTITAYVTYKTTKKNTETTIKSVERTIASQHKITEKQLMIDIKQKWLDEFKEMVRLYDTNISLLIAHLSRFSNEMEKGDTDALNVAYRISSDCASSEIQIGLHLSYEKDIYKTFIGLITDMHAHIGELLKTKQTNQTDIYKEIKDKIIFNALKIIQEKNTAIEILIKEKI